MKISRIRMNGAAEPMGFDMDFAGEVFPQFERGSDHSLFAPMLISRLLTK